MFTEQTLNGEKRAPRPQGSEQETKSIQQKAIKLKLFIYTKQIHDSIIKMLKAGVKTPIATIGKIAAETITKFEKDGAEIVNDPDVLEALSKALIKELITLAASIDVLSKEQVNSQTLFSIVGVAQAHWEKMNPERADPNRSKRMLDKGRENPTMQEAVSRNAEQKGAMARRAPQQQAQPAPAPEQQQPQQPQQPQPSMPGQPMPSGPV